ncbi:hypothetical protein PVBG_06393 [Plasmodium vivax Brazil I]|uniref:Uncharacterized protein n=1 Tax=Plasmodium vivax (strain Brazil I) TaxID=1033975 RepID=A0A0J9VQ17_PLAV1|nr:hypothetical protein PVBG_06393 [Plasmodium vivax Brazil I]
MLNDKSNNNNNCRYFMYWLYWEKKLYTGNYGSPVTWNDCIRCVWDILEKERGDSGKKCEFENEIDSYAIVQIMKIIDDMCAINTQTTLMNDIKNNREKCMEFNKKIKSYLGEILRYLSSIPNNSLWKEKYFKIEKSCSQGKIYDLFAERVCPTEESSKVPNEQTCNTQKSTIQQTCTPHTCNNLEDLCQLQCITQQSHKLDELCQDRCTSQPSPDLEQLCPRYCDQHPNTQVAIREEQSENPAKNSYLQLPVTVFSSVVGTIFFFLFLYKVKDISL